MSSARRSGGLRTTCPTSLRHGDGAVEELRLAGEARPTEPNKEAATSGQFVHRECVTPKNLATALGCCWPARRRSSYIRTCLPRRHSQLVHDRGPPGFPARRYYLRASCRACIEQHIWPLFLWRSHQCLDRQSWRLAGCSSPPVQELPHTAAQTPMDHSWVVVRWLPGWFFCWEGDTLGESRTDFSWADNAVWSISFTMGTSL